MSWNAREWEKKEAVLIQLFYLVFAQPPLFCAHLFGMIEVKIFILQHENSGELCLNKFYHLAFSLHHPTTTTAVKP